MTKRRNGNSEKATHRALQQVELLRLVSAGASQADCARLLGVHKSVITRRMTTLARLGRVRLEKRGVVNYWRVTANNELLFSEGSAKKATSGIQNLALRRAGSSNDVSFRWHDLLFRMRIARRELGEKKLEFSLAADNFEVCERRHWSGFKKETEKAVVTFTPEHVLVQPRAIVAETVEGAVAEGYAVVSDVRRDLQRRFPGLVLGQPDCVTELRRQHLAMQGGLSAPLPPGVVYRSDRLVIDSSLGVPEIETVSKRFAVDDMFRLENFYEKVVSNRFDVDAQIELNVKVAQIVQQLVERLNKVEEKTK